MYRFKFEKILILSILLNSIFHFAHSAIIQSDITDKSDLGKTKMLWFDAEEDIFILSNKAAVRSILNKSTAAGINSIAIDIKPPSGYVLYNSKIAPKLTFSEGNKYPKKFDLLESVVKESRQRGLSVHAVLNIFSEGFKTDKASIAYSHPDGKSVLYDVSQFIKTPSGAEQIIMEINQRSDDDSLVLYRPDYGEKIYATAIPENVIDGNIDSLCSRWISNTTATPHWLILDWQSATKIDTIKLYFDHIYIIPKYRIQYWSAGVWQDAVIVDDNIEINPIHSFTPVNTRRIRLLIEDSGLTQTARLHEIEVFSIQGTIRLRNLAQKAQVRVSSIYPQDKTSLFYIIRNNKIIDFISEYAIGSAGLPIPRDGYLLSVDGKTKYWAEANFQKNMRLAKITRSRLIPSEQYPKGNLLYLNPSNPIVQERALDIIAEVAKNYNIDGIILNRVKYENFQADFSELSRQQFESFIGEPINRWPEDIYEIHLTPLGQEISKGKYYKEWIYWRASIIRDFIELAQQRVKEINPEIRFGVYVGNWYPNYYKFGVNWASEYYDFSRYYDWATPAYRLTGYAGLLDYLGLGLYYPQLTIEEAFVAGKEDYASLEGGMQMANHIVRDVTDIYTSLYFPNISTPDRFKRAIRMALNNTDGVIIFSMIHFEKNDKWDLLKEALEESNFANVNNRRM